MAHTRSPELVMVELPFLASARSSAALTMLGGVQRVQEQLQQESPHLHMRLSPQTANKDKEKDKDKDEDKDKDKDEDVEGKGEDDIDIDHDGHDPLRRPLRATRRETTGVLVKIRRRKKGLAPAPSSSSSSSSRAGPAAPGGVSVSVVGRVTHSYHFDQPADYQFLSSTSASASASVAGISSSSRPARRDLLETVPSSFCIPPLPSSRGGAVVAPLFETGYVAAAAVAPTVRINPQSLVVTVQAGLPVPQDPGWRYDELKGACVCLFVPLCVCLYLSHSH